MPDHHPRYVCLHFDAHDTIGEPGHASSYVLDRWRSHRHVGVYHKGQRVKVAGGRWPYFTAAERADRLAARLNARHDAWIADGQSIR